MACVEDYLPLAAGSCASAPVAKAAVTRRPATRTAVGSDAYTLESSARAILSPSEMGGGAAPGPPRVTGRLATYHGREGPHTPKWVIFAAGKPRGIWVVLLAAEETGEEAAVFEGVKLGFEADAVFGEG